MKHTINSVQWKFLSKKAQNRIREWIQEKYPAMRMGGEEPILLDVTHMIEFLEWEELPQNMESFVKDFISHREMGHRNAICDELFEAVRKQLEYD